MIAVLSDVHGNLPALEAVLADIERVGVERIWCLGDTLGYGPHVNECMALVTQRCEIVLAGNHDLAVRGDLDALQFAGSAGDGVRYAQAVLTPQNSQVLAQLTPQRLMEGVELYHASARDPVWEYVRDPGMALRHLQAQQQPLSWVGHSHLQLAFELPDGGSAALGGAVTAGDVISLTPGVKRVLNPGSVGQPRDRDPRAAWALLAADHVRFHRVEYNIPRMAQAVLEAGLPAETAERLALGW